MHFYILVLRQYLGADEARRIKLVCRLNAKSTGIPHVKVLQYGGCIQGHVTLQFWEISANISKTVQDRHLVAMEDL